MMFDICDSSSGGEILCKTCIFGLDLKDEEVSEEFYICAWHGIVKNVGVCQKYYRRKE